MNDFIALVDQIIALAGESANELSDEEASAINSFIQNALQFIQEKKEEIPELTPEVPESEIESSNVNGFKFDPKTGKLLVQFHGKYPLREGPVYQYSGFPPFLFDILKRGAIAPKTSGTSPFHDWHRGISPSLGASVNAILKAGNYPYQKVA